MPFESRPIFVAVVVTALILAAAAYSQDTAASQSDAAFQKNVASVLANTCSPCHNSQFASGGLNVANFQKRNSVAGNRDAWEVIAHRIRAGEMPPAGIPRPPQSKIDALLQQVESEFAIADRDIKPDPGHVTARRLNRNEYSNTIRDLFAVEFRADRSFPTDDSGDGFDNIADVLTISPLLMEKYLTAAERIAARALGTNKLPKPMEIGYSGKTSLSGSPPGIGGSQTAGTWRRLDAGTIEVVHHFDFDGEYTVRIGLPGQRGADARPVTMNVWVDGKLAQSVPVETKPSKLVYFDPYSEEQVRLAISEGDHTVRAGFVDDEFLTTLPEKDYFKQARNKYPDSMTFVGPYPASLERASRQKILICDPKTGAACVEKIVSALARRAYRRPVTRAEIASLVQFVNRSVAGGHDLDHGLQVAIEAILVSPNFLFRIERDLHPADPAQVHRISDVELASRLSYFLWRSMPDDELLGLGESAKLHEPEVLDAQVKRLLADPRSVSIADNFAGQWLELRNLDVVKPDPDRFLYWGPELREAMKAETRLFFDHILRDNRPLAEFLDARYTFLNERLAKFYGIDGVKGPEFRQVELTNDQRGGLLSQASVLTVSSYPTRTSVVIRGKYILQNILGTPPPPPPPDVPPLDEAAVGTAASLRQQMEKHRANPACATCHAKMDPLGFALENYDGIGKWRTMDGKFPVDSSGTLPNGKTFRGPSEMRTALLAQLPEFAHCVIEKMLIYSLGRGLQPYDRKTVDEIGHKLAAQGYPFQSVIYEVARSFPFQSRRGEALTTQNNLKPKESANR
jgi:mono/diheme cytochrome c family protein